jgi:hypothetical protein
MKKLIAIGIGIGLGVSALFGNTIQVKSKGKAYCVLQEVYNKCHSSAVKEHLLGKKEKCKEMGAKLGAITQIYLSKELKKNEKEAEKVGEIFAITCYAGCMNNKDVKKALNEKCGK